MSKKPKYLTKRVKFGSKEISLYSLDGNTWSTRREELAGILERHAAQRVTLIPEKKEPGQENEEDSAEKEQPEDEEEAFLEQDIVAYPEVSEEEAEKPAKKGKANLVGSKGAPKSPSKSVAAPAIGKVAPNSAQFANAKSSKSKVMPVKPAAEPKRAVAAKPAPKKRPSPSPKVNKKAVKGKGKRAA